MKNRKSFKNNSGGIVIIFKKNLSKHIQFIESDSEFVQWVEISEKYLNINEKLLLGCVYIPPDSSIYSSDECFTEIEDELVKFSNSTSHIAIVGDMNSRTSIVKDFIVPDEQLIDILDIDDENIYDLFGYFHLSNKNIPLARCSRDNSFINKYGTKLIDFCKRCNMFIANGRIGKDRGIGRTTCKMLV